MKYISGIADPVLIELLGLGLTDSQIAVRMKFSRQTICQRRARLGLEANFETRGAKLARDAVPKPPEHVPSPVDLARRILGCRVTERNGAYWLDGRRPVSAKELVWEANRVRLKRGQEPFGPEAWR